ncbi:MAG: zinc-binding dehydrogenase [Acidimicrobiales bacterium]|jgi:threonine dehydrogenase-like Zn-dependent dehydrogenase
MKALVLERNLPRFAASRVASLFGSGRGAGFGPLQLLDAESPDRPGDDWYPLRPTLSGICGSDLATVDGRTSRYFEDMVSFPFVPGHEVVGVLDDGGVDWSGRELAPGSRAVIEPVLGCAPRHIAPLCAQCRTGHTGLCGNLASGALAPGLQTGFCTDTGGGWSTAPLMAHASQLHAVPDALSDQDAVMIEPTACAVHAALSAPVAAGDVVAVVGAGTLGLTTIAALHALVRPQRPCTVVVGAKHPRQRELASSLGADQVVPPDQLARAVRRRAGSLVLSGRLTDGADVVFDCVGSAASITEALSLVRARGTVVLVGMPAKVTLDLAPLWHRELTLVGAYAYGNETAPDPGGPDRRTFELATDLVGTASLGRLVSALYPLERYEEALAHAGAAGRRGAVKVAFDLRKPKGRTR